MLRPGLLEEPGVSLISPHHLCNPWVCVLSLSCSCQQPGLTMFLLLCPILSVSPVSHCCWGKVHITRWQRGHLPGSVRSESCLGLSTYLSLKSLVFGGMGGAVPLCRLGFVPSLIVNTVCSGPEQHLSQTLPRSTAPRYLLWLRPSFQMQEQPVCSHGCSVPVRAELCS